MMGKVSFGIKIFAIGFSPQLGKSVFPVGEKWRIVAGNWEYHPETLLRILLTIIKQTPAGGATMEDLLEAYREIKDRKPSQRTIYRIINRLNLYLIRKTIKTGIQPGEVFGDKAYFRKDILDAIGTIDVEALIPVSASAYRT